ncbi:MAG TPA: tRNA preQ1(34) S-adenosylmethionine ribosyltransferase-isomerase QueA [Atribacteraceae bacterium]|nr:tRNA preQ1(34) S-adenosylmethionine ribosyltransferase-isomerase QueA [Atribacteraceae bacterium]
MYTREFDYHLPEELIAQTPIEPRDSSRLLVINRLNRSVSEHRFTDIIDYFQAGDVLVLNNTKVIAARLPARRAGGGKAEVFLLRDLGEARWEALVKPGNRIPVNSKLTLGRNLTVTVTAKTTEGGRIIQFRSDGEVEAALREVGQVPLPPYIKKPISDPARYQTVYASAAGSVAAPTAALHFTAELLDTLQEKGVTIGYTTLHMGLGSFRPIREELLEAHRMPVEYLQVPGEVAEMVNRAKKDGRTVVACGTDVVRTLESAARDNGKIASFQGTTDLFITPGYRFRVVDRFITNLHLPRSSHLVLVSAFAGRELIFEAYAYAVDKKFRFYTFGDATLML